MLAAIMQNISIIFYTYLISSNYNLKCFFLINRILNIHFESTDLLFKSRS